MSDEDGEALAGFSPDQPVVSFDYIKAPSFQSLRADGVIGGLTPSNRIHMAMYSERPAIPRRMTYAVSDEGELGQLLDVQSREAVVREMSADLFMDLRTAEAICTWLGERVLELRKRLEQ